MATQIQIRGAAAATQQARTLSSRVLDVDMTNKRICVHDSSTVGGIPHVNYIDAQNQTYTYGAASGIDTITVNMAIAPNAYVTGQRFTFKAANTNTGSATLNINGLGAKTIKKKDIGSGTLIVLDAGDIIRGGIYTAFYDGTNMLLEAVDGGGLQSVSQGDLNTSIGTWSTGTISTTTFEVLAYVSSSRHLWVPKGSATSYQYTLPGGQYGFITQAREAASGSNNQYVLWLSAGDTTSYASTVIPWFFTTVSSISNQNFQGQQRYITSSPPFDLGDGEMAGFIFAVVNNAGEIQSTYAADVPPWAYNGPTSVRADKICPITHKKYRRIKKPLTIEQILNGVAPEFVYEEITHDIKNADMPLIPHPFGAIPDDHKVVLLDTQSDMLRNMIDYQNVGGGDEIQDIISNYLKIDNESLKLKGPRGVTTHKFRKR